MVTASVVSDSEPYSAASSTTGRLSSRASSTTTIEPSDVKREGDRTPFGAVPTITNGVRGRGLTAKGGDKPEDDDDGDEAVRPTSVNGSKNADEKKERDAAGGDQAPLSSGRRAGAGWHRSAIRWAPLNVPLQRRLQTLAVLWHSMSIPIFLSSFLLLCAIPLAWPILVPYLVYTLVFNDSHSNGTQAWRSDFLRRSKVWSAFASYFPMRLHRTTELDPTRKYIFGYHPHGIISHGAFAAFATEALGFSELFPGITNSLLTLDSNFRMLLYREYVLSLGIASVSRESIENLLSKGGADGKGMGRAVTIVVGGARESLDAKPGQMRLVLNSRKGFVKLAIRMGADLVPTLSFGENDLYDQVDSTTHPFIHKFQLLFKKLMGFTIPLFHARGIFNYDVGLMPYRREVNIVVGQPIKVVQQGTKDGKVDQDYLDRVHAEYVQEVERLWDEYKDRTSGVGIKAKAKTRTMVNGNNSSNNSMAKMRKMKKETMKSTTKSKSKVKVMSMKKKKQEQSQSQHEKDDDDIKKKKKRMNIQQEYDDNVVQLMRQVDDHQDEDDDGDGGRDGGDREEERGKVLRRFGELVAQKGRIERELLAVVADVEARYGEIKGEVAVAVQGRLVDVSEARGRLG
ncbi:hypothetical protein DV738_g4007, partial [Chaetothyriales sp. CBS 135597]